MAELRWVCLQHLIDTVNKRTVLEYAAAADAVADTVLMDACLDLLLNSEDRYIAGCCLSTVCRNSW